ncbi:hypothetical protein BH20VER1_BH20VER1_22960 [soil metagenome]
MQLVRQSNGRTRSGRRAFALYEVLIGVTIFVVGVLALGRAVGNVMNASMLSAQEDRVRLILSNRMAEIQAAPGKPDEKDEEEVATAYGPVKLVQTAAPAGLKTEQEVDVGGITLVRLVAEWSRGGVTQTRQLEFYVYRAG